MPLLNVSFLLLIYVSAFFPSLQPLHGCPHQKLNALFTFRASFDDGKGSLDSWAGDKCCKWRGVHCDQMELGGHVTKLDLGGLELSTVSNDFDSPLFQLKHLKHLDLSDNYFWDIPLPAGLGSLTNLTYLDMSSAGFSGELPPQLGNLTSLRHLDLGENSGINTASLQWLSNLQSLEFLSMDYVRVNDISWGSIIDSLSHLTHLDLSECYEPASTIPVSLLNLSSLAFLDLSRNGISGSIPSWMGNMSKLTSLDLSFNDLNGSIPTTISQLGLLTHLKLRKNSLACTIPTTLSQLDLLTQIDLSGNRLEGTIPRRIGNLTSLKYLDLSDNMLTGSIPPSMGNLFALTTLELRDNKLSGSLPLSFAQLSSLLSLDVSNNQLNGSIPSLFSLPAPLQELDLSSNNMSGTISEILFQNTPKLTILDFSDSAGLRINFNSTWIPPFQLETLSLRRCNIGGPIPRWISTQFWLQTVDLFGTNLVGDLSSLLWQFSPGLRTLNLSSNHLHGHFSVTSMPLSLRILDLSMNELNGPLLVDNIHNNVKILLIGSNKIEGQIPASLGNLTSLIGLDMSNNSLTGNIPASLGDLSNLQMLNLENNHLDGEIPGNLGNLPIIEIFNVANNRLKGEIPAELGNLSRILSFRIGKNNLQGHLPRSLSKMSNLLVLDMGENNLRGHIPDWIANFSSLQILVMRSNNFHGKLLPQMGQISVLQVLDLSSNSFSGAIPDTYLNFQGMDGKMQARQRESYYNDDFIGVAKKLYYKDGLDINMKGEERHYPYVLSSLTCIDLSNNKLNGQLPPAVGNLKGLMILNLSMNTLSGPIPDSVGNLEQLESLDLSLNNFSGQIPSQIGSLDSLGYLNLSYNSLSGRIPQEAPHMTTFEISSYLGNPNLWGCPLERKCYRPSVPPASPSMDDKEERNEGFPWYWMSVGLSVGMGFSGVVVVLTLKVRWRKKAFDMMDSVIVFLFEECMNWRR